MRREENNNMNSMENVVIDQMRGDREGYRALVDARDQNRPIITVSNHQASMWPSRAFSVVEKGIKRSTNPCIT